MRQVVTSVEVCAPAGRLWSILTDFPGYPTWNPFIVHVRGEARPGADLSVTLDRLDGTRMRFRSVVRDFEHERELSWTGNLMFCGLIAVKHRFAMAPADEGRVLFQHCAQFRGLLVGAVWQDIKDHAESAFALMNWRIKRIAEVGSVEAWRTDTQARMSSDYNWKQVQQGRFYHDVLKALQIIINNPRPIEHQDLQGWTCGKDSDGKPALIPADGIPCGYHPHKVPAAADLTHPVILGAIRGKPFVIDGAHRLAKCVLNGAATAPVVRLTQVETVACIRDGFHRKVEFESLQLGY